MNKLRICFDLDGVKADFVKGAVDLIKDDHPEWIEGVGAWGETMPSDIKSEIWKRIDAAGESFWVNLPLLPWAKRVYNEAKQLGAEVIFLTSSSSHASSGSGKILWMQKHFGGFACRNYLIGPRKEFCATPATILVDDNDHKIDPFREAGGYGVLVPQEWNTNRHLIPEREEYVVREMRSYAARIKDMLENGDHKDKRIRWLEKENEQLRAALDSARSEKLWESARFGPGD